MLYKLKGICLYVSIFVCIMLPNCFLISLGVSFFSILFCLSISAIAFYFSMLFVRSKIELDIASNLRLQVNAINHNFNEALISASSKNEPVSLENSLSIKENLYAIESMVFNHSSSIATHHTAISPILSVTLEDYMQLSHESGVNIRYDFDADKELRIIRVNPSVLNKALSIVISNAISVTGKGGLVKVSTELTPEAYLIRVEDHGGGIKSSVMLKLSKGTPTTTFGRRVDKHNRVHYGLGFIALKRLLSNTNISAKINSSMGKTVIELAISRKSDSIGLPLRALS